MYQRIHFGFSANVSSVQNITSNLKNHKDSLGFQKVGTHIDLNSFNVHISPQHNHTIRPVMVDFSYYQGQNVIPDEWLVNASWESLHAQVLQPNTMLCPYLPDQFFSEGNSITLQYTDVHNVTFQQEVPIVGFYRYFPLEKFDQYLISSASNIPWNPVYSLELTYYNLNVSRIELFENIEDFMELSLPEVDFSTSFVSETDYRPTTFSFLNIGPELMNMQPQNSSE